MRYPILKDVRDDEEVIVVRVRNNVVASVGYLEDALPLAHTENGRQLGVALAKAMRQGISANRIALALDAAFRLEPSNG